MAGHSKFANIKHRKAAQDAKRGKVFTKIGKEITIAAKECGGDPNFNAKLRMVLEKAKSANMTKDRIEHAIKKGTGEIAGEDYIEIRYEGYGPSGVAFIVDAVTDNKNRTAGSVRAIFTRAAGELAEPNAVAWNFEKKGLFEASKEGLDEDTIFEKAISAGAEDVQDSVDAWEVICAYEDFESVKSGLEEAQVQLLKSEVTMIAKTTIEITSIDDAKKILALYDKLDADDDVQEVYANFEFAASVTAILENE
ncbi:MAG: YebC/PmpR family DNA-binding transcriptional regulator [Fusobacteria bacterium]|nr:YebC/PmpR family DNA-binding transcriptional regulator [Fusobacteriota bacterium]